MLFAQGFTKEYKVDEDETLNSALQLQIARSVPVHYP